VTSRGGSGGGCGGRVLAPPGVAWGKRCTPDELALPHPSVVQAPLSTPAYTGRVVRKKLVTSRGGSGGGCGGRVLAPPGVAWGKHCTPDELALPHPSVVQAPPPLLVRSVLYACRHQATTLFSLSGFTKPQDVINQVTIYCA
jgi:hypothetical protein